MNDIDDLGLSIDMLDVDRLRDWARLLLVHGADISNWGSVPFVAGKMQIMATEMEKAIRDIGRLRSALRAPLEDFCSTCGDLVSRHFTPCNLASDAEGVLRLLVRLVNEGKKPAALRVLARHMNSHEDDGKRIVQSALRAPQPTKALNTVDVQLACASGRHDYWHPQNQGARCRWCDQPEIAQMTNSLRAPQELHRECHDLVCNGDRAYPRGEKGHSCSCNSRALRAPQPQEKVRPLHPRHPYDDVGSEWMPETCSHGDASGRRTLTCRECALFAINRMVAALRAPQEGEQGE